jgi:hypothetical protein
MNFTLSVMYVCHMLKNYLFFRNLAWHKFYLREETTYSIVEFNFTEYLVYFSVHCKYHTFVPCLFARAAPRAHTVK